MATASERIKLGAFIAVAGALLATVIAIFTGVKLLGERDEYVVLFPDSVTGLEVGSTVVLRGVDVGTVTDIAISEEDYERVRVTLGVEEGTIIKTDADATLRFKGLTGLKMVEIRGGTAEADVLPPGSRIPAGEAGLAGLVDDADRLTAKTEQLLDNLLLITGPENQARVTALLETGVGLTERLDDIIIQVEGLTAETRRLIRTSVAGTTEQMNDLLASADALVDQARTSLDELDLGESVAEMRATLTNLRQLLASLDSAVGGSQQLTSTMRNLARASRNLEQLSESLRQEPSRLLFDKPPKPRKLP